MKIKVTPPLDAALALKPGETQGIVWPPFGSSRRGQARGIYLSADASKNDAGQICITWAVSVSRIKPNGRPATGLEGSFKLRVTVRETETGADLTLQAPFAAEERQDFATVQEAIDGFPARLIPFLQSLRLLETSQGRLALGEVSAPSGGVLFALPTID